MRDIWREVVYSELHARLARLKQNWREGVVPATDDNGFGIKKSEFLQEEDGTFTLR